MYWMLVNALQSIDYSLNLALKAARTKNPNSRMTLGIQCDSYGRESVPSVRLSILQAKVNL